MIYYSLQIIPYVGGIFNFVTTCIASSIILAKVQQLDWLDFIECNHDSADDNFTTVTYVACGLTFIVVLIHGIRFIIKCCSSIEEKFEIIMVNFYSDYLTHNNTYSICTKCGWDQLGVMTLKCFI